MSGKSENFWKPRALKAEKRIADLERELVEALEKYGKHSEDCEVEAEFEDTIPCSCGGHPNPQVGHFIECRKKHERECTCGLKEALRQFGKEGV